MDILIIAGLAVAGLVALSTGGAAALMGGTQASDLAPLSVPARAAKVKSLIQSQNLAGMDWRCVWLMADMEQGISEGLLTPAFRATNSLFNRHKGLGKVGVANSDGYWTGNTFYVSEADPDLRIYTDMEQSVKDFVSLMQDGIYAQAYAAATQGDISGFISAIAAVPYSAQIGYETALNDRANSLGVA